MASRRNDVSCIREVETAAVKAFKRGFAGGIECFCGNSHFLTQTRDRPCSPMI